MKFGPVPVATAEGTVLAHTHKLPSGQIRKGTLLDADSLASFTAAGITDVIVARFENGDVGEDDAAAAVATALAGDGLQAGKAYTGRVNLMAARAGIAVIDPAILDRLNAVDEAITVATLPPFARVAAGQMIATIKIIPFAAPRAIVERCVAIAREAAEGAISAAPFSPKRIALVQTILPGMKSGIFEKAERVTRQRVTDLGCTLAHSVQVAHDTDAVAAAIAAADAARPDILLIAGASAIVDRRDVIPAGLVAAGGDIVHFGMPVDPGNLMLTGRRTVEGRPVAVLGLPGCARSPKLNGFDWILERLVAGLEVGRAEIVRLGAGGLLMDVPTRPLPRAEAVPTAAPRIAALILAAGRSTRMGVANKLMLPVDGVPMAAVVAERVLAAPVVSVQAVVGHQAEQVAAALERPGLVIVRNPDYREGLSTSLKAGIKALPPDIDGVLVCLGDMPRIRTSDLERLIAAFDPAAGRAIIVPIGGGRRGNPVLIARRFFPEIEALTGDQGARPLIDAHTDQVAEIPIEDDGILLDIDTPEALQALTRASAGSQAGDPVAA